MLDMKKLLVLLIVSGIYMVEIFAWQGMPTPALHVDGRYLKDPTGKNVVLHGWMQPTSSWFNGRFYSDPNTFTPENCEEALNVYKSIVDLLSDPNPLFGADHGWYNNFVRMWTPSDGWNDDGTVDTALQDRAWYNMFIPYVEYCREHGIYVVFIGNCPDGGTFMSAQHKSNMIKFWTRICNRYPEIKNADNVMFEICNEPIVIESQLGNDDWGSVSEAHDKAVQTFFQDIADSIRATGADNVIWIPGLIWQDRLMNFATYPISGKNIGYAGHMYPFGANDLDAINSRFVTSGWKACSDLYPIIVTEGSWHTMGNQGIRTGTTEVFGNAVRNFYDTQGNISWICGMTEELIDDMEKGISGFTYPDINSGRCGFEWWPQYTWAAPDDGTPNFISAFVSNENPSQIKVVTSWPIENHDNYDGFSVKVDDQTVVIDSVVPGDTSVVLIINLAENITNDNSISLSYNSGNIISIFGKSLVSFTDTLVQNLLKGASPLLTDIKTNENGDTLIACFNMKMKQPSDISSLTLTKEYNGETSTLTLQNSVLSDDSTSILFSLAEQVFADYTLYLSYSGNNIVSSDSGALKSLSDILVLNNALGLPLNLGSGTINADGISGTILFSKSLASVIGKSNQFELMVNGVSTQFTDFFGFNNSILFTVNDNLHFGDTVKLSFTPGDVAAADGGLLAGFNDFEITNTITEPNWIPIPGKVEAEDYLVQMGTDTETTQDVGGGLNVGWIDDGDWLEYAIENKSSTTDFEISFRIASPDGDGEIMVYLDDERIDSVVIPKTGGYQSWESVSKEITIGTGIHYLKLVVSKRGFNINYTDFQELISNSIIITDNTEISVFPNPVSDELTILTNGFSFDKVEIIDVTGKIVLSNSVDRDQEHHIKLNLSNGIYIVKISDEKQFYLKRIIVDKACP